MNGPHPSLDIPRAISRVSFPDEQVLQRWSGWSQRELLEGSGAIREGDSGERFAKDFLWSLAMSRAGYYERAWNGFLKLLRITPKTHPAHYRLRLELGHILLRLGDTVRAERLIRKSMSLKTFGSLEAPLQNSFRSALARAYQRKGWLSMAAELYRAALDASTPGDRNWLATCVNFIHCELRADQLDQVRLLLRELEEEGTRDNSTPARWLCECSWLSYAVELRDPEGCARHLQRLHAISTPSAETDRNQLLVRNYEADVLMVSGRLAEAAELYRSALQSPVCHHLHYDLVPSLVRGLAESLHGLGDHQRAVEHANEAIQTGIRGDVLEELIALRIRGQCEWALGRESEARATFLRAKALHIGREFLRERRRLTDLLDTLGIEPRRDPDSTLAARAPVSHRASQLGVFELKDGRAFVTLDHEFERRLRLAAESDLPILIEGETGTGKELVARLIHEHGPRARAPFMVVDCSTLPETLVESELFGATRGAFTGCSETRDGIVARADTGTLFLDELPELSLAAQAKLLRLLQEKTYRRVGDTGVRRVDVRFIASTNRSTAEMLERRRLKPDLYYRLNGHAIRLLPLRERREEIAVIALHLAPKLGLHGIEEGALAVLERAEWAGNVRELEMVLRAAAESVLPGEILTASELARRLPANDGRGQKTSLRASRLVAERSTLQEALDAHGGNVSAASRSLGISRQAFYKALQRTGGRSGM